MAFKDIIIIIIRIYESEADKILSCAFFVPPALYSF